MIPLRDNLRPGRFPIINISLIVLNAVIFVYQSAMGREETFLLFMQYGVIPLRFFELSTDIVTAELYLPFITSIFLHGSWFHLLSNMLYLWVFGDNVEDRLGHAGYLLFYLAAGVAASLAHVFTEPASPVPVIGASGAIAGVLGSYFIFYPRARILTLIPIGFFITTARISAKFFLIFWFFLQIFNAFLLVGGSAQTVAWWAHIGGFVFGAAAGALFLLWKRVGAI
ncbi:MAG TPA: rhomboid family intramembrane serine protease [Firmicutes bacterium]|nr:rhomboid family intramembrane serine protease [Bacillota bacterium]